MKKILLDCLLSTVFVFIVLLLFPALFAADFFIPFRNTLSDFQITDITYSKVRDVELVLADTNIVIVDIEEITRLGIAKVIRDINENNPKVICIDRIFKEENKKLDDLVLADALAEVDNLVLSCNLSKYEEDSGLYDSLETSDSLFSQNTAYGFSNLLFGKDKSHNTVRDFVPAVNLAGKKLYSFAVEAAGFFDSSAVERLLARNNFEEIIKYRANWTKFHFLEGNNILEQGINRSVVEGKIVLLGIVGAFREYDLLEERYFTPLNERYAGRTFPDMSRIEVQANIISMILHGNYSSKMQPWLSILIAVLLCYANMLIFSYICIKKKEWYEIGSLLIFVVESLLIMASTVYVFTYFHYQFRLTEALFAVIVSIFAYQIYGDTLKPLVIKSYNKFLKGSTI